MCRLWAEQDEGPYHRDEQPFRRDVVDGRDGTPLQLGLRFTSPNGRLAGAVVELWHCDALGRYSGFPPPNDAAFPTAAAGPLGEYVPEESFLRGAQRTDADGEVEFRTIFPGWYPGRTVHIHLILRTSDQVLTTQLYFPDRLSDEILATAPYDERPGRDTTNDTDEIFPTGGEAAVLEVERAERGLRAAVCLRVAGASESA